MCLSFRLKKGVIEQFQWQEIKPSTIYIGPNFHRIRKAITDLWKNISIYLNNKKDIG